MEMHQVKYFLAICKELNFTRAAKRCKVAQPSLSAAIQRLEMELGGELFVRTSTGVHLTRLGRAVLPHLEQISAHAERARKASGGAATIAKGVRRRRRHPAMAWHPRLGDGVRSMTRKMS